MGAGGCIDAIRNRVYASRIPFVFEHQCTDAGSRSEQTAEQRPNDSRPTAEQRPNDSRPTAEQRLNDSQATAEQRQRRVTSISVLEKLTALVVYITHHFIDTRWNE